MVELNVRSESFGAPEYVPDGAARELLIVLLLMNTVFGVKELVEGRMMAF